MLPTTTDYEASIHPDFLPTAALWQVVEPLLPSAPVGKRAGRPLVCNRQLFYALSYLLRAGLQWKALPRCLGASSTVHDRFQQWTAAGVFRQLWALGLLELHMEGRLDWSFQRLDGCQTTAPLGGEAVGPYPTDQGKGGVKRHLLTEAQGLPVGLAVTAANVADVTQVQAVFDSMPLPPPPATEQLPQGFCADKGYDVRAVRKLLEALGYADHSKSRGEEAALCKTPGYRARRWVIERTHSWFNRFRRLLIRWEKKVANYEALLHLACANTVWKHSILFG